MFCMLYLFLRVAWFYLGIHCCFIVSSGFLLMSIVSMKYKLLHLFSFNVFPYLSNYENSSCICYCRWMSMRVLLGVLE